MQIFKKNPLVKRFIVWFFLLNSIVFCFAGWGYLYHILSSDSLFINFNTHSDYHNPLGISFVLLFTLANYCCYMMLLSGFLACFVLLISLIIPSNRLIWFLSPLLAALAVSVIVIDSRVYSMFHFHINSAILELVFTKHWWDVLEFSSLELILIAGFITLLLIFQYSLAVLVWTKIIKPKRAQWGKNVAIFWFGGSFYCYMALCATLELDNNVFSQQIPTLPLYSQLLAYVVPVKNGKDFLRHRLESTFVQPIFSQDTLHYPKQPLQCSLPTKPYNIILIMVDALRFDALQWLYMPNMTRFANQNWQFLNHMSAGNGTQPGIFSLFYSIPSTYWTAALNQKVSPALIDQLIQFGYNIQTFWSAEMESPNFNETIFLRFPNLRRDGAPGADIPSRDRQITQEALTFLSENQGKSPFFLSLFYDGVHGYCSKQDYPQPFQPIASCFRFHQSNATDPTPARNRYYNAVGFVDVELSKLLKVIEERGYLDNSIIILTADHGEEFNDNHQNYWGHTSNYSEAQVHVPLVIHWPNQEAKTIQYVTSGYDMVPTLFQGVFSCKNPTTDYSVGYNLLSSKKRPDFVLAGSYINMGLIEPDRITTLQASGQITITDKQVKPMPEATPRMDYIQQALALMRKYYIE